jgi:hypothetical protein
MTSTLVTPVPPAPKPAFTFPGIFRSLETGSLWIAARPGYALRLFCGPKLEGGDVGDRIAETSATGLKISSEQYEQVTTPVTITFNP